MNSCFRSKSAFLSGRDDAAAPQQRPLVAPRRRSFKSSSTITAEHSREAPATAEGHKVLQHNVLTFTGFCFFLFSFLPPSCLFFAFVPSTRLKARGGTSQVLPAPLLFDALFRSEDAFQSEFASSSPALQSPAPLKC